MFHLKVIITYKNTNYKYINNKNKFDKCTNNTYNKNESKVHILKGRRKKMKNNVFKMQIMMCGKEEKDG